METRAERWVVVLLLCMMGSHTDACPANSFSSNGACGACPAGTVSPQGAVGGASCVAPCSAGRYLAPFDDASFLALALVPRNGILEFASL